MSDIEEILVSDLLIDLENPRLPEQSSQLGTILAMVSIQKEKLAVLAEDIVERGINTSDLLIVMPAEEDQTRYTVLEGNRRLVALKLLATPELLADATPDIASESLKRRFQNLSKRFRSAPIDTLSCAVYKDRREADPWVKLRHTGENDGAGIVRWGGREVAAYTARLSGKKAPHLLVLDFVAQSNRLSQEASDRLDKISITNLERLINTPYVKDKLGIEVVDDQLDFGPSGSGEQGAFALLCRHRALVAGSTAEVFACRLAHRTCENSDGPLFSQAPRHWPQRRRAKVEIR